ncbi:MAG: hypothetical protein HQK98_07035 [Nitrospirae bacterium]|nr:hypothetical protein [Nitrospirota bacterium]
MRTWKLSKRVVSFVVLLVTVLCLSSLVPLNVSATQADAGNEVTTYDSGFELKNLINTVGKAKHAVQHKGINVNAVPLNALDGTYSIMRSIGGSCMTTSATMATCSGGTDQLFTLTKTSSSSGETWYTVKNPSSGKCLGVYGTVVTYIGNPAADQDNRYVSMDACDGSANQQFAFLNGSSADTDGENGYMVCGYLASILNGFGSSVSAKGTLASGSSASFSLINGSDYVKASSAISSFYNAHSSTFGSIISYAPNVAAVKNAGYIVYFQSYKNGTIYALPDGYLYYDLGTSTIYQTTTMWNTNPTPTPTYTLSVTKSGTGSGTVTSSDGGISCGSTCSSSYTSGTSVTLTAAANSGSTFSSWSGCDTTNGSSCTVAMSAAKAVTATFTANVVTTYTVTPSAGANGTISPSTPQTVNSGSTTSFTVTPTSGYTASVGGSCGGSLVGTTYTTNAITANCTVAATFTASPPSSYTLTVTKSGTGSGTVTASSGTLNWSGNTGTASYTSGTSVTLTAAASSGSTFSSWNGCDNTSGQYCAVTMSAAKSVTATFTASTSSSYYLTVTKSGTGSGTVTSTPSGISCGSTCSASYTSGTSVTLAAGASSGSTFSSWSGCDSSSSAFCTVSMSTAKSVTATFTSSTPSSETYSLVTKWGSSGSGDGQFNQPIGIAVDSNGYVYVADLFNYRIQKFTSNGTFVTKWGSYGSGNGQFIIPEGLAADSNGYVYVADPTNNRIQKFTSDGTFVTKWGSSGSGDGQFNYARDVTVDSNGYVYVNDRNNSRIQKFTSDGTFVTKWGSSGSGNGQFSDSVGIAVDSNGYVYVAEWGNHRIQRFTNNGTFVAQWGSFANTTFLSELGISVDSNGYVFVAGETTDQVQKFTSGGTFVTQWGSSGSGDGQFNQPFGSAVDSNGYVYVIDRTNNNVQKFKSSTIATTYSITVTKAGTGSGTITPSSGTLSWSGNTGTASYTSGTVVYLTAAANSGSTFSSWSGCDNTSGQYCAVTMSAAKSVTATFTSSGGSSDYNAASAGITAIYNQYASFFGTKSGSIVTGTSGSATYYVQWFTNGAALVAWTDGYMYTYYNGTWYALGVVWNNATAANTMISTIYSQYASWFGTTSGGILTGTNNSATYYVQWFTNGAALVAFTDGNMYVYYNGNWYALGVNWK